MLGRKTRLFPNLSEFEMTTPSKLAKSDSEHAHQTALFAWCAVARQHGFEIADHWDGYADLNASKSAFRSNPVKALQWIHAIPNGGARGDDAKTRAIRGGALKAEGVRSGVPDVFLPWPAHGWMGLYIEMKKPDQKPVKATSKGGLSDEQIEFGDYAKSVGYGWVVCYSWRDAANAIRQYVEWNHRV